MIVSLDIVCARSLRNLCMLRANVVLEWKREKEKNTHDRMVRYIVSKRTEISSSRVFVRYIPLIVSCKCITKGKSSGPALPLLSKENNVSLLRFLQFDSDKLANACVSIHFRKCAWPKTTRKQTLEYANNLTTEISLINYFQNEFFEHSCLYNSRVENPNGRI